MMNPVKILQTAGPSITQKEIDYVLDAVQNGWYEHWGDYIQKFEQAFAKYIGVKYALATSSCSGALHLALKALQIGNGDEVIVPDLTWIQTAAAIIYVGATPIFAEIEPDSWTLEPASFKKLITKKTKAVLPVHLYGHPANMSEIMQIAKENDLYVVEDAAPSIGATCAGKKTGSFGDFGAFSFQGAKLLVTGEGGMLVSDNDELFERAAFIGNQGRDPVIPFWIKEIGLKYKMSNLQAALGLAQLERVDELIEKKRQIYGWYQKRLAKVPELRLSVEKSEMSSIHWMTSIVLEQNCKMDREELMKKLKEKMIDTRPIFPPMSGFPMFQPAGHLVCQYVGEKGINLPSALNLTEAEIDYTAKTIIELIRK